MKKIYILTIVCLDGDGGIDNSVAVFRDQQTAENKGMELMEQWKRNHLSRTEIYSGMCSVAQDTSSIAEFRYLITSYTV